jgi:acyl-CoA thioesterase
VTVEGAAFDRAIAVQRVADGRLAVDLDARWTAPAGLNGGYLAAVVLNAVTQAIGRPERLPRSITVQYLASPQPRSAVVEVTEERSGRTLTSASARLVQDGRTCLLALVVLSGDYPTEVEFATPPPPMPAADDVPVLDWGTDLFPIAQQFEYRPALGPVPLRDAPADVAVTGGWLRLRDGRPPDAPLLALYLDAWWPASFVRVSRPAAVPTIDLTVHFRAPAVAAALDPRAPLMVRFASRTAKDGFVEEDGEVWAPDGTLLATSRQLAVARLMR